MRNDAIDYIYSERYRLALHYNMTELSDEFGVRPSIIKMELRKQYHFDYSMFRRSALRWYVFIMRPHLKASELLRRLNISRNTLYRLYGEVGIHFGQGGDRHSDMFVHNGYGGGDE